jgi:hypothetical protein
MTSGGSAGLRMMIALPRPAPPISSRPRAVVRVNESMLWPGGEAGDRRDDLRVGDRRDCGDGRHHRDRRLAAAADHVHVRRRPVAVEVDDGNHARPELGRGQVDRLESRLRELGSLLAVGSCRGRVEDELELAGAVDDPVHAFGGGVEARLARASEPVRVRVDPDDGDRLQHLGALELDHQIGADVPGTEDDARCSTRHGRTSWSPIRGG